MTDEQDETPLDPRLKELAQGYNRPPVMDRDAAWKAIEARRQATGGREQVVAGRPQVVSGRRKARGSRRPVMGTRTAAWISGIAALLIIGIGIGRMTAPTRGDLASANAPAPSPRAA